MRQRFFTIALSAAVLLGAWPLSAQEGDVRERAAAHFERGLTYLDEGRLEGAVVEFQAADALVPEPRAAYNVALAYARLHRPVQAARTLRKCLERHPGLQGELADQIRRLLADQMARIGRLKLVLRAPDGSAVEGARVRLDGEEQPIRSDAVLEAGAGFVELNVSARGMKTSTRRLSVSSGETQEVVIELEPEGTRAAFIAITSALPGVDIFMDGRFVGKTPLAPLRTTIDRHVLTAMRPGYEPRTIELTVRDGATASVALDLAALRDSRHDGELALELSEPDATVSVDGQRRASPSGVLRLIAGPHLVRVERAGHEPVERMVEIPLGGRLESRVWLEPSEATRLAQESARERRRFWGTSTLIAGAVLTGVSGGFLAYQGGRIEKNDAAIREFNESTQAGGYCQAGFNVSKCSEQESALVSEQSTLEAERTWGFVGLGLGVAGIATGAVLLLGAPEPYAEKRKRFLGVSVGGGGTPFSIALSGTLR
jgi:hypothetical protein